MLSVVPLLLSNVLQAGRQTILIIGLLLMSWFVLMYGHRSFREMLRIILRKIWLILPLAAIVLTYFFFISARRHDVETLTLDTWMRMGNLSARSIDLGPNTGNEDVRIGAYSGIYYYTHQLQALDTIINSGIEAEGLGRGVLGWTLLQFRRTGIDLTFDDLSVQYALLVHGENMSGWRTGFGTLISDFGVFGSLVFVLIMSIILGRFVRSAYVTRTDVHLAAAVWLMGASMFMIQFFPGDGLFTMNLLLIVFLRFRRLRVRRVHHRARTTVSDAGSSRV